jgi:hypothetical protein
MSGCTAAIRPVLVIGLLSVLAAGCRFPDTCDLYPGPDSQAAAEAASWDLRACNGVNTSNDQSRSAKGRPVAAFALGAYCTDDVTAVELTQGEQLRLFQANE